MSRKDLLDDLATDQDRKATIVTSTGRSYTARVRRIAEVNIERLDPQPPIERLELELGRIELVPASAPATLRASIEQLLCAACPALPMAPAQLLAMLDSHLGAIAQLVDAASEPAPAEAGIVPLTGGRAAC